GKDRCLASPHDRLDPNQSLPTQTQKAALPTQFSEEPDCRATGRPDLVNNETRSPIGALRPAASTTKARPIQEESSSAARWASAKRSAAGSAGSLTSISVKSPSCRPILGFSQPPSTPSPPRRPSLASAFGGR